MNAASNAGFDDYLAKPIRQAELQETLQTWKGRGAGDRDPKQPVVEGLLTICGGDEAFAHELAASFLEAAPLCLARIDTSLQSGDSGDSGRRGSWPERDQPDDRGQRAGRRLRTVGGRGATGRLHERAGRSQPAHCRMGASAKRTRTSCEYGNNRMKILIAEDQPTAALFLRYTLEKMGHEAIIAPDGE